MELHIRIGAANNIYMHSFIYIYINHMHVFFTVDAASQQVKMFLTESLMLHGCPGHVNILQPIAVCQYSNKPSAVLYPFSNKGNLKKYTVSYFIFVKIWTCLLRRERLWTMFDITYITGFYAIAKRRTTITTTLLHKTLLTWRYNYVSVAYSFTVKVSATKI